MHSQDIARALGQSCPSNFEITRVVLNSRLVKPGDLFVAISGNHSDGHHFIKQAVQSGASAILCSHAQPNIPVMQWVVSDPCAALTTLAAQHRAQQTCKVVAVTGSNGKTTVKEMIAAILPKESFATPGNFNNHLGVPISLIQLKPQHRYAVFELGANHVGEIAHTVGLVQPCVTLINNIAPAHLSGFGSISGVVQAKGEIYQGLLPHGTAVINDDDVYAHAWDSILVDKKIVRFSLHNPTSVHAIDLRWTDDHLAGFTLVMPLGQAQIQLKVPGIHMVSNALAAAACAYALGLSLRDIVHGLQNFGGVSGRMTFLPGKNNSIIIDDTYNANLNSVLAAVDVLSHMSGKRCLILGDMGELGSAAIEHHQLVGATAREKGIECLFSCGTHSAESSKAFGAAGRHYVGQQELVDAFSAQLDQNTTVLIKGSRSAAMEKIVQQLIKE